MFSRSRRGALALVIGGSALVLTGCGTGFGAATNQVYQAGAGTNHRDGPVQVLNALFVSDGDTATFSAGLIDESADSDALTGVGAATLDGTSVTIEIGDPIDLPSGELVKAGEEPEIVIRDPDVTPGEVLEISLTFKSAAPVEIQVPVVEREEMYDQVAPATEETPSDKVKAQKQAEAEQSASDAEESSEG